MEALFMKLIRSLLSIVIAIVLIASISVTIKAQDPKVVFKDLPTTHWAFESVTRLIQTDRLKGEKIGEKFFPNQKITREKFAKLFVQAMGLIIDPRDPSFKDVSRKRANFKYIEAAKKYLPGVRKKVKVKSKYKYYTYFKPTENIKIKDAVAAVVNLFGYKAKTTDKTNVKKVLTGSGITSSVLNTFAVAKGKGMLYPNKSKYGINNSFSKAQACYLFNSGLNNLPSLNKHFQGMFPVGAALKPLLPQSAFWGVMSIKGI